MFVGRKRAKLIRDQMQSDPITDFLFARMKPN